MRTNIYTTLIISTIFFSQPLIATPHLNGDTIKTKRFNAIIKEYEQEVKKDPKNLRLILAIADEYSSLDEYSYAIDYYLKALKLDPANIQIKAKLGQSYLQEKNLVQSHDFFEQVLKADPNNIEALAGLGRIEALKHHISQAEIIYQKVLDKQPKNPTALFYLADLRIDQKRYPEAETILTNLLKQNSNAPWVLQSLTRAKLGPILAQVKRLEEKDDYPAAIALLKQKLNENPDSLELYLSLARLYTDIKNYSQATQMINEGLERFENKSPLYLALGYNYLRKNDLVNAEATLNEALENGADPSEVEAGLGRIEALKGDTDKAEKYYEESIQLNPFNPSGYSYLALSKIGQKHYSEAIEIYKKALKNLPESNELNLGLGFAYLKNGDLETGKDVFNQILKNDPENAEALAGLGQYEELTGHTTLAIKLYKQALNADPSSLTALSFYSKLLVDIGHYDAALTLYKSIQRLQPHEPWVKLAILDAKHGRLLEEIKKMEKAKDYHTAEILWKQLLTEEPSFPEYYLRVGLFYHGIKEYEKAIDTLLAGIQVDPDSSDLYAALGLVYLSTKDYSKARTAFKKSLKRNPKNPDALAGLGDIALVNEKYGAAEKLINSALTIDSEGIAPLSTSGDLLMKEKRYSEAQKVYEKLLALRPKEKWIKLSLDDAIYGPEIDEIKELIKNDQFSEAAERYRALIEKSPDNPNFYFGLGQIYMRLKEYGKSEGINLIGLEKNPDENELRIALGYDYIYQSKLNEARKTLAEAIEIDEKNPEGLAGLGRVDALNEDYSGAEVLYKKALAIDPKNLSAMSFYADLLMKQKRYKEAQKAYEGVSQILPNAEWVKKSLQDAIDGPVTQIANELADREEFELAAITYSQLIDASPNDPARYLPLGQMYINMQQYCRGIETYLEGLMIDPDAQYLWRAIAFADILMEEFSLSQCIFDYLLDQDPKDAQSWAGLGRIQALNGSNHLAEDYYTYALELAPNDLTTLSFLAELQQNEEFNFSALCTYDTINTVSTKNLMGRDDPFPKWETRGYHKALNLTQPTLAVGGAYHEEDQWDPTLHRWSAQYLVYGGKALMNYPLCDYLTVWGSVADQIYDLKDLITHTNIYSFDVQRFHIGARSVFNPAIYLDGKIGLSTYSPNEKSTFSDQTGTIFEPSLTLVYHTPIRKATVSFITISDLIARDFSKNVAKLVRTYTFGGTYEQKVIQRGWVGLEASVTTYNDYVDNDSQRALIWMQWRPPYYSDNILFRYFAKYQNFDKNIPDYYTYKPQIVNQLQVTLEKSWRVCWADTFYTSLSYGHGWQDTRTRFSQIIVINPIATVQPYIWDDRQFNLLLGTISYKYDRIQFSLVADYYRDTEKYTMWSVGADLTWRF